MKINRVLFGSALISAAAFATLTQAADTNPARIGPNTTLTFAEKTSRLTPDSRAKLDALVADAKANGTMNEVQVAAWSDNPAPRENEQLSKPDRTLVERRAAAVSHYLKTRTTVGVSTYNMADRASWLARMFDTAEAEFKAEVGKGGSAQMSRQEFQIFKNSGQPSKAVVLVIMKH